MGFRVLVSLGIVLLVSGGKLCAATENQFNISASETLNETSIEGEQTDLKPRTNVNYRLKIYQLRKPAAAQKPPHPFEDPQRWEPGEQSPERPGIPGTVPELLMIPIQGPDLNPPFKPETKVLVIAEQRVPVQATSVALHCGEEALTVEVSQNFLGNGQLIYPSDLTLSGCPAQQTSDNILRFQTELHGCGSTLMMTEEALVYSFSLMYSPTPIGNTVILKTNPAQVVIECHYQRRHYVSSSALRPTWTPFAAKMQTEKQLRFFLHLMTEDWQSQRPSNVFFLNDVIHIEAAVLQAHHVPLRVYVDNCVATANPNPNSQPRHPFINNHGCLSDGKLTGAKSYFLQRSREDKLHFQLKAFGFHKDQKNSLYITCHLKATMLSFPIGSQHKACSFLTEANRWVASGGDNKVCSCCETSCSEQRRKRRLAADVGDPPSLLWQGTAALGPIVIENIPRKEHLQEPASWSPAASTSSTALVCELGTALALVMLAFMGAFICSRIGKPKDYTVCT